MHLVAWPYNFEDSPHTTKQACAHRISHYRCVCLPYTQARRLTVWLIQSQPMLGFRSRRYRRGDTFPSQISHLLPNF